MTLPTLTQAFGQQGSLDSPIYYWPENSEVVASAARFNAVNQALYGFIKQLETETGATLTDHGNTLADHAAVLLQHAAALANRYTKAEADATTQALTTAIQTAQTALDNLNSLYQTDAEATAALTALSEQWNATSADFQATVTGWMNARYTKTETDNLLARKADNGDSYTKGESDQLLSQKASAGHNHTLKVGNGTVEMFQVGTQERIDFKPGHGISLAFDDNLNQITVSTDLAADFTVSEQNVIGLLRDNVSADGDTLAKLRGLIAALETALTADDVNLDTLQEVITRIKSDEGLITGLTSGKVNVADIIDNLTSTAGDKPLSAAQGHALKGLIDSLETATATALAARYTQTEADTAISSAVATETARAQGVESTLSAAISTETARAQAAEATRYTKAEADALLLNKANQATTYSKTETDSRIQAVVGAAPAALDTLQEIAAQLASDESAAAALTNTVAGKADKASTLAGYGITNAYTKTETDTALSAKTTDSTLAAVAKSGSYADLSNKPTLGTASGKDVAATGNASTTQVVLGSDTRLSDARAPTAHTHLKSEVGLGNVDNTSDLAKPISTATQTALDLKANQATTYTKTETDSRIQAVVGAAPAALDTLQEIAAQLASDESAAAALTNTVAGKASAVHSHTLPYLKSNGTTLNINIS